MKCVIIVKSVKKTCSPLLTVLICLSDAQPVGAASRSGPASSTRPSALTAHLGTAVPGLLSLILEMRTERQKTFENSFLY